MTEASLHADGRKPATIADVARLAGVAKGTVSNCLNGTAPVSEGIRARVAEAVEALAYEPSEIARSFTSRRRAGRAVCRFKPDMPRLTTVGYVSVDCIARLPSMPREGRRVMASEIRKAVGGPAANVAAIAAGIGGEWAVACSLITAVGTDQDSDWAVSELASRGVDVITPVERREGRLSRALVLVGPDARPAIVAEPLRLGRVDLARFIETADVGGRTWCIHMEGYQTPGQIDQMRRAREAGFVTAMHATGLPPDWLASNAGALFVAHDLIVLQRETLEHLPGCPADPEPALAWLSERLRQADATHPQVVILTLGTDGAAAVTRGGAVTRVPAPRLDAVDKTGAGDALTGAFLALWLNGLEPADALPHACAAGSLVVTRLGAQELRPTHEELVRIAPSGGPPVRARQIHPQE